MQHQLKYSYLQDSDFLKEMDLLHLSEQYVKITILDWQEDPIQDIQGIVTGGNINLDRKIFSKKNLQFKFFCLW